MALAACLPPDAFGAAVVLVAYALQGARGTIGQRDGILVAELREDSWLARVVFPRRAAIALGHAVLFGPHRARERWWKHERVRIEQGEAAQCASALAAVVACLFGAPVFACYVVWALGSALAALGASLAAWLRGSDPYFGNVQVRAAFALDGADDGDTRRSRRPTARG